MRRAFSLIELLVVIAVIGALAAVMIPSLVRARQQARIVAVNSDLYQIGLCLEMYMNEHGGKHPPTRQDCTLGWEDHQLPPELVDGGYLPAATPESGMSARISDRFNPKNTYKYQAVGELYQNGRYIPFLNASLYVPRGFPGCEGEPADDIQYDDATKSPVTWVIYSQGPNCDEQDLLEMKLLNGPVAKRTWYRPDKKEGLIVRVRLKGGRHIGSFEGSP